MESRYVSSLKPHTLPWSLANTKADQMCFAEIFLPSYANYHFDDLERRQDPVEEITVTDEEVQKMFPL